MKLSAQALGDAHALQCELAAEVLRSSGSLRLRVTGWSMLPTVWPGDTLLIERIPSDSVSTGDIVLFGRDRRLFAHRVVTRGVVTKGQRRDAKILTRGDAMPAPDPPVSESEVQGRVSFIFRNGKRIQPTRRLRFFGRALAAVLRRSVFAARVVMRAHGMLQKLHGPSSVPTSRIPTSRVQTASL